ncbi:VOC family protein [Streptococcus cuniculipharyngis]|uniref:VOC family protein n=1 Tax=Streptococcus cuniculipharyngis TaxID=1562651 RepID=A0A5C5SB44_9STRE|nr:VOC family protein [Streptococcus cuniculipharyngis]TWS96194.1 VOC family protein [Streptococcus cuniculipharyngis]
MYQSQFELGHVALNVKNLELQSLYYQQVLGMTVLEQTDQQVDLGVGQTLLLRLLKTERPEAVKDSYGLYHFALLLPSRKDLGQLFNYLIANQVPLVGASDHDYSEAIYLEDTEGNGIEVYQDRPMSGWDVREDGRIVGDTRPIAEQELYDLGQGVALPYRLPQGTRMGHVHLSVKNSGASSRFYQDLLGVTDKFRLPSAVWLASGDYHHHLAVNQWAGQNLADRESDLPGLAYYTIYYDQADLFTATVKRAEGMGLELTSDEKEVSLLTTDGILLKLFLR